MDRSSLSNKKRNRLSLMALEPRLVFDGAAAVTADLNNPVEPLDVTHPGSEAGAQPVEVFSADLSPLFSQATSGKHELVVVDGSLTDVETLLADIERVAPDRTVLVLDPQRDAVAQLVEYLEQHVQGFDAIHLFSHGGSGWLALNGRVLQLGTPD